MNEKMDSKQLKLTIVAVVTMIALIAGATYAYFYVGTTSNFGTSTINATADNVGSVILQGNNVNLTMDLTAADMAKGENDISYYASSEGKKLARTEEVVGTASLSPTTDTNYYHCSYTLRVTQSYTGDKNMYNIFKGTQQVNEQTYEASANEFVLIVNGTDYDLSLSANNLTKEIPGEFYIKGTQVVEITAGFQINNLTNKDQTLLAGSGVNIGIQVKDGTLSCTAEEEPIVAYYTYEGTQVTGSTANKISDYRNLNVYRRLDTSADRYYVYPTSSQATCESDNGGVACESVTQRYFIKETTLNNQTSNEVCSNYGNTLICMKETDWENSEELKSQFTNAGLTCAYNNFSTWVGDTKPESGYLSCSDEDPTNGYSVGEFNCEVYSDGVAGCRVNYGGSCGVGGSGANCSY